MRLLQESIPLIAEQAPGQSFTAGTLQRLLYLVHELSTCGYRGEHIAIEKVKAVPGKRLASMK